MQDNILMNLATIPSTLSIVLRFVFSIFVATMIPYSFFPLKQSCLVIIDETVNKSISENLNAKRDRFLNSKNDALIDADKSAIPLLELQSLSPTIEYFVILVLHISIVTTSILVQELAVVFDFACSFGVTFLFFILPSLFMLLTLQ